MLLDALWADRTFHPVPTFVVVRYPAVPDNRVHVRRRLAIAEFAVHGDLIVETSTRHDQKTRERAFGAALLRRGPDYLFRPKCPRSVFLNRDSFPLVPISLRIAEYSVAQGVLPPGLVQ
jgi:hypothetical protein